MAFPQTPLDVDVEFDIDGTWTDVTSYVRGDQGVVITRGKSSESSNADPGRCTLTLENTDGRFSPRNPTSPYYGILGRNTPIRVSVHGGTPYLNVPGSSGDRAATPDAAALDITGDIDIRIDAALTDWGVTDVTELAGKYNTVGNQRSYRLLINPSGYPVFSWSEDGATFTDAVATHQIQGYQDGRVALRATLDVDNGAGGWTVNFYTATSFAGGWDDFGTPVTDTGTTSIFSGTAPLQIGDIANLSFEELDGKVFGFELYNGIAGSKVVDIDFTAQTVGDTSFVDDTGLTWTLSGNAAIDDKQTRFVGEVSSWPPAWDTGGFDVTTTIEASGILRRLGAASAPLPSCLTRSLSADDDIIAYWPMEDGVGAESFYSPVSGVRRLSYDNMTLASERPTVGGYPAGSAALPVLADGAEIGGKVPSSSATLWQVEFLFKIPTQPATERTMLAVRTSGTVKMWRIMIGNGNVRIRGDDEDGTALFTDDITATSSYFGGWRRVRLRAEQNGGNVDWSASWFVIGGFGIDQNDGSFAGSVGKVTYVTNPPGGYSTELTGMGIGHIAVFDTFTSAFSGPDVGESSERAGDRMLRLSREEDVPVLVSGTPAATVAVGAQQERTFLELIQECADADQGIVFERRDSVALAYRDKLTLYDQATRLTLDYSASEIEAPLSPVDDDQSVTNDVTVTRDSGSSYRSVLDTGALSVQDPPNGVGSYASSVTYNLYDDDDIPQIANWRLHVGTWDETRYPQVTVNLARNTSLIADAIDVEVGDRIKITNPPEWLPPETIDLMVIGYTERFAQYEWKITFVCVPYGPWAVSNAEEGNYDHVDTAGCELAEALDTTETGVDVLTTGTYRWVDSATYASDFPFDVMIGGERMTVTACTGTTLSQTFTVTRSVNGVVKTHASGTDVRLFYTPYVAL